MAFDLASARSEQSGGFDLTSAKPFDLASAEGMPSARRSTPLADQIPEYDRPVPAATAPVRTQPLSTGQKIKGAIETGAGMATSAVTALPIEIAKIYGALTSGQYGTQAGIQAGERYGADFAKNFYSPRTQAGQEYLGSAGEFLTRTGLQGVPLNVLGDFQQSLRPAARALTVLGQATAATSAETLAQPFVRRAITKGQENLAKSYQNAAILDAAQARERLGAVVNPALSNPTTSNVVKGALTGTAGKDAWFSKKNEGLWIDKAKEVIGAEKNTVLNDAAIETALDKASKPYDAVKGIVMQPTDEVVASLESARVSPTIGGGEAANAVNKLVDTAQEMLSQGRSGADVLRDIRQLRRNANSTLQSQKAGMAPDPAKVAEAEASIKIANTLEMLIDANAPDAQTLQNIRQARTKLAQIFDVDRATNKVTGRVDPMEFAKMLAEGKQLTGPLKDMGMFAGVFPSNAVVSTGAAPALPSLSRSGPAGTMGYAAGAATGVSPIATSVGGAGIGGALSGLVARRMATPQYQATYAMPRDYRLPVTLPPTPEAPNFVMQGRPYVPQELVPNKMLGYNPNVPSTAEVQMNRLRAEDRMGQEFIRRQIMAEETQQAAAEAAARRPTSGEVILDFDPITGRFREASQGLKGATPETFSNFGSALETASNKITEGKRFDMTAAEKVAWNKTKVDLAEVAPGFKALNDKAIAEKMMDRAWVEQTAAKAREKAAAFDQLAARAANERARQTAMANRERMLDLAEQMEEGLRMARPDVSGKQQGPKTRAAQRNKLNMLSDQDVLNKLLEK